MNLLKRIMVKFSPSNKNMDREKLTPREQEVFDLMLKGVSYLDISEKFGIHKRTVMQHASNIFKKLEVKNRESLVKKMKHKKIS